ncbi:ribonuclease, Rne/Rng family protein [Oceaniovalibus guishaninsula JLT2003]|uniref:Ribonuclease E n=1 Tax=Oceaniovalibus guishaninsula JLT2003 TaxID=1231392 RepID=K2I553_9RHOB|nr:ribonuclease E/G [Oceaniovalibus guishaninsula]EKE44045.1 ribonuclease, Rne/Rng family protein [Oceaniovalibus guishaninsula JLT2003]
MAKKMLIDATHAEETRVVVVDGNRVEEFDFESEAKRQLAGNIYLAKVTRVEPSLQAAFVEYGGNRHGFLAFSEIHPDYYQIPVADREALLAEEAAMAAEEDEDDNGSRRRRAPRAAQGPKDATAATEPQADDLADARTALAMADIPGMDVVDLAPDPAAAADDDSDDDGDNADRNGDDDDNRPYVAADDASERDSSIESVGSDDPADEISRPRKPRARRYKIQEVVKVRQIMLVQVVKEERGNKGAALTTYLSLAGRYCVLMPNTARGGGISRKITNVADRKKLKEIAQGIEVPRGAGLIIRTAGAKRTRTEIKRDYEYLQRMWEQIRELTLRSIAPAPIYQEGDLIKRSIRDLYNRDIDEVLVEGEAGYRIAKDFMKMIMPSHAKNVKYYHDQMPLFARYQVESYLSGMFNPTVQLKSGGYIVIGVTEALVAIDVNSGRATKEGSIEETAFKTNCEAADEVARQLRLRDLAGLIVIDFIDMEDRKNNAAVEKRFKDALKTDRARIQVGKISAFGLLEMSRQRLHPGMIEATTQPCPHCHGTGLLRSDENVALGILRQLEEEGTRERTKEVLVTAPVAVCNYLINHKRDHIAQIEARYGMAVRLEADPTLTSPDTRIEKFKTQTARIVRQTAAIVGSSALMDDVDDNLEVDEDEAPPPPEAEIEDEAIEAQPSERASSDDDAGGRDDGQTKKRRRRRRRRKSNGNGDNGVEAASDETEGSDDSADSEGADDAEAGDSDGDEAPRRRRSRSRSRRRSDQPVAAPVSDEVEAQITEDAPIAPPVPQDAPKDDDRPEVEPALSGDRPDAGPVVPEEVAETVTESAPVAPPVPAAAESDSAVADDAPREAEKPKRRGWWSLSR